MTNSCTELVAFSRITNISALPICDVKKQIKIKTLKKIGNGNSYNNRERKYNFGKREERNQY